MIKQNQIAVLLRLIIVVAVVLLSYGFIRIVPEFVKNEITNIMEEAVESFQERNLEEMIKSISVLVSIMGIIMMGVSILWITTIDYLISFIVDGSTKSPESGSSLIMIGVFLFIFSASFVSHHIETAERDVAQTQKEILE